MVAQTLTQEHPTVTQYDNAFAKMAVIYMDMNYHYMYNMQFKVYVH